MRDVKRTRNGNALAAAVWAAAAIWAAGCAGAGGAGSGDGPSASPVVWTSGDQYVRVEPRDDRGDPSAVPNDHPAEVSSSSLGDFLAGLRVHRGSREDASAAFAPDQLEVLTRELPAAFRRAGPAQDVTFAVLGVKTLVLGLGKGPTLATGRMFLEGGRLNLILGDVHRPVDYYSGRPVEPFVPGSRAAPRTGRWVVEAGPGLAESGAIAVVRSDWARADLGRLASSPAAASPPAAPPAPVPPGPTAGAPAEAGPAAPAEKPAPEPGAPARPPAPQPAGESGADGRLPEPAAAPGSATPVAERTAPPPSEAPPAEGPAGSRLRLEDVQQRLWVLDELHRKGLVTDEEYRASRARILEGL